MINIFERFSIRNVQLDWASHFPFSAGAAVDCRLGAHLCISGISCTFAYIYTLCTCGEYACLACPLGSRPRGGYVVIALRNCTNRWVPKWFLYYTWLSESTALYCNNTWGLKEQAPAARSNSQSLCARSYRIRLLRGDKTSISTPPRGKPRRQDLS